MDTNIKVSSRNLAKGGWGSRTKTTIKISGRKVSYQSSRCNLKFSLFSPRTYNVSEFENKVRNLDLRKSQVLLYKTKRSFD